jgi:hypothetical protein
MLRRQQSIADFAIGVDGMLYCITKDATVMTIQLDNVAAGQSNSSRLDKLLSSARNQTARLAELEKENAIVTLRLKNVDKVNRLFNRWRQSRRDGVDEPIMCAIAAKTQPPLLGDNRSTRLELLLTLNQTESLECLDDALLNRKYLSLHASYASSHFVWWCGKRLANHFYALQESPPIAKFSTRH